MGPALARALAQSSKKSLSEVPSQALNQGTRWRSMGETTRLREQTGPGLVVPTWWRTKPALRLCLINPGATSDNIEAVLRSSVGGVR
ncbi:unannotated protein [freshwater metagenome]|uniref:Unannotated protein n=1 Tax=freshwater metagenome TaxID=449393 RepID=A0A6J6JS08_9ZZZZ